MSEDRKRPGSADTMLLILKPRQEDYKSVTAQLASSESERMAYRKNRVIQMSLNVILAEICLQQKSSYLVLKNEEQRFLQEVSRRQAPPPSVRMLQEMRKKFPVSEDKETPAINHKTSVNPMMETCRDRDTSRVNTATNKSSTFTDGTNKLPSSIGIRERHVVQADVSLLTDKFTRTENSGSTLELPIIKSNYVPDLCDPVRNDSDCNERKSFSENEVNKERLEVAEKSGKFLPSITDDISNRTENVSKLYMKVIELVNNIREINEPQMNANPETTLTTAEQFPTEKKEIRTNLNENLTVTIDDDKRLYEKHASERSARSVLRNKKKPKVHRLRPVHVSPRNLNIISQDRLDVLNRSSASPEKPKISETGTD